MSISIIVGENIAPELWLAGLAGQDQDESKALTTLKMG
jgi:hypothetical protein